MTGPRIRIADRYLIEEVGAPFIVGVLVILVMLLGDHLYDLLNLLLVKHVEPVTVGKLLLFILPEMMTIAFPLATILAVSLGVSRLAHDSEWSSLRVGGLSLGRMLVPISVFGLVVGSAAWIIGDTIAPVAKEQYRRIYLQLSIADPTIVIEPQSWFRPPGRDSWFFVNSIDKSSGRMRDLIVFSDLRSDYPTVLVAKQARLAGGRLHLDGVVRHMWRADGTLQRESETREVEILLERLVPQAVGSSLGPAEMSSARLREMIDDLRQQGIKRPDQVIDLHRKYAAPVACLVLALMCVPLNLLTAHRGSFAGLLITAVLVIVYFLTLQLGVTLARDGYFRNWPVLGVWLQNLVFGALTLALLRRCR